MTDPYAAGRVWWGLFDFNDGEGERKKYFVLLNDCSASDEKTAAAFTTSKGEKRYRGKATLPSPCGGACFRIDRGQEACFLMNTWVQFDNIHPLNRTKLKQLKENRGDFLHSLAAQRFRSILNCAKKSDDIEGWARNLAERTLKALNPSTAASSKPAVLPAVIPPTPAMSHGLVAVRVRYESRCSDCRMKFVELLRVREEELTVILSGSTLPSNNFLSDADVAFDLLAECACLSSLSKF